MRSVLLPTLLNGKDHSRQEHVLSSNGIEKIQSHRILPSHRPPGEEGAIAAVDWICSRPSRLREKSMPSEWPSSPPSHEIQHGEAAAMDPPPCLGEGVTAMAMWAGPRHRHGSVTARDARICAGKRRPRGTGRDAPPLETLPSEWDGRRRLWILEPLLPTGWPCADEKGRGGAEEDRGEGCRRHLGRHRFFFRSKCGGEK